MDRHTLSTAPLAGLRYTEYASLGVIPVSASARDVLVDLCITPGQSDGQREVTLFARISLDGAAWTSGPAAGMRSDDGVNLYFIDPLPLNSPQVPQRRIFGLVRRLGFLPPFVELVVRNMTGDQLPTAGHLISYAFVE